MEAALSRNTVECVFYHRTPEFMNQGIIERWPRGKRLVSIRKGNNVFWRERNRKKLLILKFISYSIIPKVQEFFHTPLDFHHAGYATKSIACIDAKAQKGDISHRIINGFMESQLFCESTTSTAINIWCFPGGAAIDWPAQPLDHPSII